MSIEIDSTDFDRWLARYVTTTGRNLGEVLREESALLAKDVMRATPPNWNNGALFSQSWAQKKKAGQQAVRRDIARVYTPAGEFFKAAEKVDERLAAAWWKNRMKNPILSQAIARELAPHISDRGLRNAGIRGVQSFDGGAAHEAARRNGRVGASYQRLQLVQGAGLAAYRKRQLAKVGGLAGGWWVAASGLPLRGVPAWIQKAAKPGSGVRVDQSRQALNPAVRLENLVNYASRANSATRFTRYAVAHREKLFAAKVKRIVERGWRAR